MKVVAANTGATALWATSTTAVDGAGAYDALGRIADSRGYVQSNGGMVTTKRTYGAYAGQLLGQETKLGTTDLYRVGSMGYLGEKLTQMTDQGTATSYAWAYDTGGRLVTATATASTSSGLTQNYSHSFGFSPVWNLTTANVSWNGSTTSSQTYTYSGTDQATQAPGGYQPSYVLTYDGMGNIVDRRVPNSQTPAETLTYTAEGYLRSIVRGASTDEILYYDALGNLAYRRSGTYLWFYAGDHATITATTICTTDPCAPTAGTVKVNVHVLLAGARIATVRTTPGQTTDQAFGNVLYFHRDRQGSVVATTTTGGVLGAQYRYGPYGELDRYSGNEVTAGSDLGYTGGLRLTGGLIHLKARVYDPSYRRFLQADIVDPRRYTYTNGDPTNYVDPRGRRALAVRQGSIVTVAYYYTDDQGEEHEVIERYDMGNDAQAQQWAEVSSGSHMVEFKLGARGSVFVVHDMSSVARIRPTESFALKELTLADRQPVVTTEGRFSKWWARTKWNFKVTTRAVASPIAYAGRWVVGGERPDLSTVAIGLAADAGFGAAAAAVVGPGALGVFESAVVSNGGLAVEVGTVARAVAGASAGHMGVATVLSLAGIAVGSGVEAFIVPALGLP